MNKLHLILFTILGTLILYKPPTDLDLGWHLQYGKQILETRQIPKTNTFSYTLPNYSWSNSYWFSQIVMYLIFSKLGYIGLSVITAGSVAFACVYFSKSLFASGVVYVGLTFFALSVRPMGFSTILMLLMLYILLKKPTAIKWLPFLFILWANVHADFVLGLFILGIYTLLHERFKPKAVLFFAACCLTTLLNPYGPDLWKTLLNETRSKQFNTILEWLPIYQYAKREKIKAWDIEQVDVDSSTISETKIAGISVRKAVFSIVIGITCLIFLDSCESISAPIPIDV